MVLLSPLVALLQSVEVADRPSRVTTGTFGGATISFSSPDISSREAPSAF